MITKAQEMKDFHELIKDCALGSYHLIVSLAIIVLLLLA